MFHKEKKPNEKKKPNAKKTKRKKKPNARKSHKMFPKKEVLAIVNN